MENLELILNIADGFIIYIVIIGIVSIITFIALLIYKLISERR